jgi:hypothetical protein
LDDQGFESRQGEVLFFSTESLGRIRNTPPPPGPFLYSKGIGAFPGIKRRGCNFDPSLSSNSEVRSEWIYRSLVVPYGAETWTMTKKEEQAVSL